MLGFALVVLVASRFLLGEVDKLTVWFEGKTLKFRLNWVSLEFDLNGIETNPSLIFSFFLLHRLLVFCIQPVFLLPFTAFHQQHILRSLTIIKKKKKWLPPSDSSFILPPLLIIITAASYGPHQYLILRGAIWQWVINSESLWVWVCVPVNT